MKRLIPWVVGVLSAALFLFVLALSVGLRYAGTADALILKSFAGYQGGIPANFHAEVHTAIGWLLFGLHTVFPEAPWFSVIQLFFLWFSCAVIVKAMTACACNHHLPWVLGLLAGFFVLAAYALFAVCRIDHDLTGSLLGAAAIAQLLSINFSTASDKQVISGMLLSVTLLVLCYCLLLDGAFAALSLWVLAALIIRLTVYSHKEVARKGTAARYGVRGFAIGFWICALCLMVFYAVRQIELDAMGDYTEWQRARAALFNNAAFPSGVTDAMLETIGWSKNRLELMYSGFLYDASITAQSMTALDGLLRAGTAGLYETAARAVESTGALLSQSVDQLFAALLPAGICLLCLVLTAIKSPRRAWLWLAPVLTLVVGAVWMVVLAADKLLPSEMMAVLAPCTVLLCGLAVGLSHPSEADRRWHHLLFGALAVGCAALACICAIGNVKSVESLPVKADASAYEESLVEFALSKPEKLIFYQPSMVKDTRLFPDLSQRPANIVLPDVRNVRSAAYNDQMEAFGLDGRKLRPRDFLDENVLVAGTDKGAWRKLMAYATESVEGTLNWALYEQHNSVYTYRLCRR